MNNISWNFYIYILFANTSLQLSVRTVSSLRLIFEFRMKTRWVTLNLFFIFSLYFNAIYLLYSLHGIICYILLWVQSKNTDKAWLCVTFLIHIFLVYIRNQKHSILANLLNCSLSPCQWFHLSVNISFGYYSGSRNVWYIGENRLAFVLTGRSNAIFNFSIDQMPLCLEPFYLLEIKFVNIFRFLFYRCEKNQYVYQYFFFQIPKYLLE